MSSKKPMLLVFAGPNGSGKSTIIQYFEKVGDYTNADDVVASTGMDIIRKAKDQGYFIKCIFILTVDPLINVARVEARVANGGHDVARDKIISRYYKSLAHIKDLIELCDILHVYDNSKKPVRIIRKHKNDISIIPNNIWSLSKIIDLLQ